MLTTRLHQKTMCLAKATIPTKNNTTFKGTVYCTFSYKERKKCFFINHLGHEFFGTDYSIVDKNTAPTSLEAVILLTDKGPHEFILIKNSYDKNDENIQSITKYIGGF